MYEIKEPSCFKHLYCTSKLTRIGDAVSVGLMGNVFKVSSGSAIQQLCIVDSLQYG